MSSYFYLLQNEQRERKWRSDYRYGSSFIHFSSSVIDFIDSVYTCSCSLHVDLHVDLHVPVRALEHVRILSRNWNSMNQTFTPRSTSESPFRGGNFAWRVRRRSVAWAAGQGAGRWRSRERTEGSFRLLRVITSKELLSALRFSKISFCQRRVPTHARTLTSPSWFELQYM